MKKLKQTPAVVILILLAVLLLSFPAAAEESGKTETVYAELNSDGSVEKVMVVNHIQTPQAGTYIDYGNYSAIDNITGEEKPIVDGEKITWELPAYDNGFYYIGTMTDAVLPWNLSITCRLNGTIVDAEDLAGQSGEVMIHIKATANADTSAYFRENFAMQLTQTLNTDLCSDITATGATSVITGKNNSLAYTILPGESLDATITFQAQDLELSGLSAVISPFSMSSFSALEDITGNIDQIYSAMDQLIDGNRQLQSGFSDILVAIAAINGGTGALSGSTDVISQGFQSYAQGLNIFEEYINVFANQMEQSMGALEETTKNIEQAKQGLAQGSQKIKEILNSLDQETANYANLIAELESALTSLNDSLQGISQGISELKTNNDNMGDQLREINSQYQSLYQGYTSATSSLRSLLGNTGSANALLTHEDPEVRALAEAYLKNQEGIATSVSELEELNGSFSTLNNNFSQGIDSMEAGYQQISAGLEQMEASVIKMMNGLDNGFDFSSLKNQLSSLQKELDQAGNLLNQFNIDDIVFNFEAYTQGIGAMKSAATDLKTGFQTIQSNMEEQLFQGIDSLYQGTSTLYENLDEFPAGLQALLEGQIALRNGMEEATSMLNTEENTSENISFASEQGSASSVQFVMSTPSIAQDTTVYTAPQEEETSFWQRFLNLFS